MRKIVIAGYGISGDGRTAILEMALASGLSLVPDALRGPVRTTTYVSSGLFRRDQIKMSYIWALEG